MADRRRVRVVVSGHVQGVFFRATIREAARELGLTGWVRNRPDGRVEAELQGPPDVVDRAVEICHDGPEHAEVRAVDVKELAVDADEAGFRLR